MKGLKIYVFLTIFFLFSCSDENNEYMDIDSPHFREDITAIDSSADIYKCDSNLKTDPIEITDYKPFLKGPYIMYTTSTSTIIMWETERTEPSVVDFGKNQISLKRITAESNTIHEVKIAGLEPDTLYYYRVDDGANMTDFFTFKTSPVKNRPFRFAAYSDSQNYPERHSKLIPLIARLGPSFILHAGDAVEKGSDKDRWQKEVFDVIRPLSFFIPYYFAMGNHEANSEYYYKYLSYPYPPDEPQHESYYWFKYGPVFVIVIDSEKYIFGKEDPQHKWIVNTLKMPEAVWAGIRIALFHESAYTEGWGHCDYDGNLQIRGSLIPALKSGGINLILNGHTHGYERGVIEGMYNLIIGGGGGDLDQKCNEFPFIEKTNYVHHFIYGDVLCDKLKITAVDIDGNEFDHFEIPFDYPKPCE